MKVIQRISNTISVQQFVTKSNFPPTQTNTMLTAINKWRSNLEHFNWKQMPPQTIWPYQKSLSVKCMWSITIPTWYYCQYEFKTPTRLSHVFCFINSMTIHQSCKQIKNQTKTRYHRLFISWLYWNTTAI